MHFWSEGVAKINFRKYLPPSTASFGIYRNWARITNLHAYRGQSSSQTCLMTSAAKCCLKVRKTGNVSSRQSRIIRSRFDARSPTNFTKVNVCRDFLVEWQVVLPTHPTEWATYRWLTWRALKQKQPPFLSLRLLWVLSPTAREEWWMYSRHRNIIVVHYAITAYANSHPDQCRISSCTAVVLQSLGHCVNRVSWLICWFAPGNFHRMVLRLSQTRKQKIPPFPHA